MFFIVSILCCLCIFYHTGLIAFVENDKNRNNIESIFQPVLGFIAKKF
uniref:Uncharacterized protein n=1 Tax=Anguilla anguilla TaxID=7936 RepID=A0A0E9PI24_ANGAN